MSDALLLEAVAEVARVAGDTALRHFRAGIPVETKRDGTPVTAADRAAEQAAREWLRERFPEDGILGEELGDAGDSAATSVVPAAGAGRRGD